MTIGKFIRRLSFIRSRCEFRIAARACAGIAFAILFASVAACSSGGTTTPTQTPVPTAAPAPTSTADATPTPTRATGSLVNEPEAFAGYTLIGADQIDPVYLIDNQGRVVHTWPIEAYNNRHFAAELLDDGNLLTQENNKIIDPDGNVVWEYNYRQDYDVLQLPNGNILMLSRDLVMREEAIALGVDPVKFACPFLPTPRVVEVRPTGRADGEVVWQWAALDHLVQDFDPEKPNYGAVDDHPERIDVNFNLTVGMCNTRSQQNSLYANALDYNAELDQIMITSHHFSEIWIIDHSTSEDESAGHAGGNAGKGGGLLYRWGNPRAYQRGTAADQRLFRPHAAHWIPEGAPGSGNVLIFNNGAESDEKERWHSSVDEIALPADGYTYRLDEGAAYGPDEHAWTYAADPPESFYAWRGSSAQRLPNGNTLITDSIAERIFEVTREGKTVWEFTPPRVSGLRRAYRYAPDHPGLRGLDLTPYRTAYRAATAGAPAVRSSFDLYLADGDLVYVKEACGQSDTERSFFLDIAPERADDLPQERRDLGFTNLPVDFFLLGALFDGKCSMRVPLPDYPVAAFRTGQRNAQGGAALWSASFRLNPEPQRAAYRAATSGEPIARSAFDLYLADGDLVYVKETCDQTDTRDRFYLHVAPEREDDLPQERRRFGFANLDFDFFAHGALFDGRCAAMVPLPDYPIASVRTGQFGPQGELWSAEIAVGVADGIGPGA